MPNDAKLGLIVGVGLVIGVAVVFFRKDLGPPQGPGEAPLATPLSATRAAPANPRTTYRSVKAKAVAEEEGAGEGARERLDEENRFGIAATPRNDNGVRMIGPIDRPDRLP